MPVKLVASPVRSKFVRLPQPAAIVAPENENPRTIVPPADTVKPAVAASPPEALLIVAPSTLN